MKKLALLAAVAALLSSAPTWAAHIAVTDQPAALLTFPGVLNLPGSHSTFIEIANTSDHLVSLKCFYVNAIGLCSQSGAPCFDSDTVGLQCPTPADRCQPKWVETDFRIVITPEQPLGWYASLGLPRTAIPIDGVFRRGPNGESNVGTDIPPFGTDFGDLVAGIGELKCYVVDSQGRPDDDNALLGQMTVFTPEGEPATTNAIAHIARADANNGDGVLVLGGPEREYGGCPSVLVMDHFFAFATNPVTEQEITPSVVLVPCTQNFVTQVPERVTVQYLVFNEFEQRFSTSGPVECLFYDALANIDTNDPTRSIFSVGVAGTLTGQTRMRGVEGGLVGLGYEFHDGSGDSDGVAGVNLHRQGERADPDLITSPH